MRRFLRIGQSTEGLFSIDNRCMRCSAVWHGNCSKKPASAFSLAPSEARETVMPDHLAEQAIEAIKQAARTGEIGADAF